MHYRKCIYFLISLVFLLSALVLIVLKVVAVVVTLVNVAFCCVVIGRVFVRVFVDLVML